MRTSTDSPGRHSRPTDRHRPSTGKPLTPDRTPGRLAPMTIARFDRWLTVRDQIRERYLEVRSEEHTSELQSRGHLVCRLLLEKKKEDNDGMHWNGQRVD